MLVKYPQSIIQPGQQVWGVWKLVYCKYTNDAGAEITSVEKEIVPLTGRMPNVNVPSSWVDFDTAQLALESAVRQPPHPQVTAFLKQNDKASRAGLIWLIQPGFLALDFDGIEANPEWRSLLDANESWVEYSSRGDGFHQLFSHEANPTGVVKEIMPSVDARAAGTMLFMTGRCNPNRPDVNRLTPFYEDLISEKSRQQLEQRLAAAKRVSFSSEVEDQDLLDMFMSDVEVGVGAADPQTSLNSEFMGLVVQRLNRYSGNYEQMLRVFKLLPCALDENITTAKRRRKIVEVEQLFELHYLNMIKNGSLELPMVKFSLGQPEPAQPVVEAAVGVMVKAGAYAIEDDSFPPPFPTNMQILADALNVISPVADDISHPSVIQTLALLAGPELLHKSAHYNPATFTLEEDIAESRCLTHFILLAASGRGKTRSYTRINNLFNRLTNKHGTMLPINAVGELSTGQTGANRLLDEIHKRVNYRQCGIAMIDEADSLLENPRDPGGMKGLVKTAAEKVNKPGALVAGNKTANSQNSVALDNPAFQFTFMSTVSAMVDKLKQHTGDGMMARFILWISTAQAERGNNWSGGWKKRSAEDETSTEFLKIVRAKEVIEWLISAGPQTVRFNESNDNPFGLDSFERGMLIGRRLLTLAAGTDISSDSSTQEDTFNRYATYAQSLSALYAWSENPKNPVHTEESLLWGIEVMEFAKRRTNKFYALIESTTDASTFKQREAANADKMSLKYLAGITKFYTEGIDREWLDDAVRNSGAGGRKHFSKTVVTAYNKNVLMVATITRYSCKFFDLIRDEVNTHNRETALRELASQGQIVLQKPDGTPFDLASTRFDPNTLIYLAKDIIDQVEENPQ